MSGFLNATRGGAIAVLLDDGVPLSHAAHLSQAVLLSKIRQRSLPAGFVAARQATEYIKPDYLIS